MISDAKTPARNDENVWCEYPQAFYRRHTNECEPDTHEGGEHASWLHSIAQPDAWLLTLPNPFCVRVDGSF